MLNLGCFFVENFWPYAILRLRPFRSIFLGGGLGKAKHSCGKNREVMGFLAWFVFGCYEAGECSEKHSKNVNRRVDTLKFSLISGLESTGSMRKNIAV